MGSMNNVQCIAMLNVAVDACDLGTTQASAHLFIYSGTVPATADATLAGQTLLADLVMSNPAFGNSVDTNPGASSTANAITDDSSANATGTATFFRIVDRDSVPRLQGTVSATGGGGELQLNSTSIVAGQRVQVTSLVFTEPEST